MTFRSATKADVDRVFDNISDISFAELQNAHIPICNARRIAYQIVCDGDCFVQEIDSEPIFIFWLTEFENELYSSFVASCRCFERPLESIKAIRKALKVVADRFSNRKIIAETASKHLSVAKWFKSIGFSPTIEGLDTKRFEFKTTKCY